MLGVTGEVAINQRPEDIAPYAAAIVERLAPVLAAPLGQVPRSLVENAAISLGRVAWLCPPQVPLTALLDDMQKLMHADFS